MPPAIPPVAITASDAPLRPPTAYPAAFAEHAIGRERRPLAAVFGLGNFSVMLTQLAPGTSRALRHSHSAQEEFVYILEGCATLHTDAGRTELLPGMCAGFPAGTGNGHELANDTNEVVVYLEVGDKTPGDQVRYSDVDLMAQLHDGRYRFTHRDGTPYEET